MSKASREGLKYISRAGRNASEQYITAIQRHTSARITLLVKINPVCIIQRLMKTISCFSPIDKRMDFSYIKISNKLGRGLHS